MLKKLVLLAIFAVSAFAMHSVEVNINDTDLEVSAKVDLGQFNYNVEPNTTFLGFRIVDADNTHSSDKKYRNDPYYEANFLMKKPLSSSGLSVGMGVKFNYTTDFSSVPLGLEATYKVPAKAFVPMYVNGSVYYGPRVLSFGTADRYYEYRLSYDIELINNGRVTLGYRSMHTSYQDVRSNYVYNQAFYFGFKFFF
ncbi:YfaZ family outer membrane protein [Sulfurimonas sp.]